MTPWGFLTCWFSGSMTSFNPLFMQGNALCLPFSLAISHACSQLSGLCLWFQPWWHIIPVLKDGIFQCKKQQKTNRGNVAMSKGFSTQCLQLCYKATQRLDEEWGQKSDNEVIVLPTQAILLFLTPTWAVLATGRHRLGLPQVAGNPQRQRGRDKLFPGNQDPTAASQMLPLFPHCSPNKEGAWAGQPLTCLICSENQQRGSASCFFVQPLAYY